jgi:hypothetical protein
MNKILLNSKEEFDSFLKDTAKKLYNKEVNLLCEDKDCPEIYPCVLLWSKSDDPDCLIEGDYVYIKDFIDCNYDKDSI